MLVPPQPSDPCVSMAGGAWLGHPERSRKGGTQLSIPSVGFICCHGQCLSCSGIAQGQINCCCTAPGYSRQQVGRQYFSQRRMISLPCKKKNRHLLPSTLQNKEHRKRPKGPCILCTRLGKLFLSQMQERTAERAGVVWESRVQSGLHLQRPGATSAVHWLLGGCWLWGAPAPRAMLSVCSPPLYLCCSLPETVFSPHLFTTHA